MKEHNCNTDCESCGADCNEEMATVTLTLDDGSELECAVLTIFPAGDHEYIALLPLDENGENEEGDVFLYRYIDNNHGPELQNVEDDAEYELVSKAFYEILEEQDSPDAIDEEHLS